MKLFLLVVTALFLSGCAIGAVKTYSDTSLPVSSISIFKGDEDPSTPSVFFSRISGVTSSGAPVDVTVGNYFKSYPSEVRVLPGRYVVVAYCVRGGYPTYTYSFPRFSAEAAAGMTYVVTCEEMGHATRASILTAMPTVKSR